MFDWGEDANLIESVLLLSVGEMTYFNFLKSIFQAVFSPLHFVDTWIGAVTYSVWGWW